MKELHLFAGAGGGIIASQYYLRHTVVGAVEFEPYCQKVLMQRQNDGLLNKFPIFGDIRDFISQGYADDYRGRCDIISGGFPCQPFSVAGQRLGEADIRNMWPQTIECVRRVQPEFIFLENVPGLLVHNYSKRIFGEIAEAGYSFKWTVLGASNVGCMHHRKRLWVFGWKSKVPGKTLFFNKKHWQSQYIVPTAGIWRTPECAKGGTVSKEVLEKMGNGDMKRKSGSLRQLRLQDQVRDSRLWPTPTALAVSVVKDGGPDVIGALNPNWVEWLMGWPQAWTSLDPLEEVIFLNPSEDPHPIPLRTTTVKENRANRIKALGNGQVPICAATAFKILSGGIV